MHEDVMYEHLCPYDSRSEYRRMSCRIDKNGPQYVWEYSRCKCGGSTGWLCDRCKEDRADARFAALTLEVKL